MNFFRAFDLEDFRDLPAPRHERTGLDLAAVRERAFARVAGGVVEER